MLDYLNKSLKKLDVSADWISLRLVKDLGRSKHIRNGKIRKNLRYENLGVMVEVLKDGFFSYAGTCNINSEGIQNAVNQACRYADIFSKYKIHNFEMTERPPFQGKIKQEKSCLVDSLSELEIIDLLMMANNKMKVSPKIVTAESIIDVINSTTFYVSSNGSLWEQENEFVVSESQVTAVDGPITQSRSNGMECGQDFENIFNKEKILNTADTISREVLELLNAQECPDGKRDLLLDTDQMYLQIHESIGHPLELDRILGDERNYAGHSFVKRDDFGNLKYGSDKLNIVFDPTYQGELASYKVDDGGNIAQKEYLIKNGKLERGIGGLESQKRSGILGTSSFRASSWNRPPIDRMGNINMLSGNHSFDEIVSSTEKGIYMQTNKSWSIDDYRIKFQFGTEYGRLIENGKLTKTVKNPNYRGKTLPFWHSLDKVGSIETIKVWGSPFCGKGEPNQAIKVGHVSPVCLFRNVEVFGGGS